MPSITTPDGRGLAWTEGGDLNGVVTIVHHGTPSAGLLYESWCEVARQHGLRLVAPSRPGYGGSDRQPGRRVADAASDALALADALGAERFLTWGVSGGGPHTLACAALAPERVVAVAALACVAPFHGEGLDFYAGMGEGNVKEFGLAVEGGESVMRPLHEEQAAGLVSATLDEVVESMRPFLTDADVAEMRGGLGTFLLDRMREAFVRGVDGWVDDDLAFVQPWGFDPADITVPALVMQGRLDAMVPYGHGEWLAARIPGAEARLTETDSHLSLITARPPEVHAWLRDRWDAAA